MKTETRKVYSCEHCNKTMLSAGAMGYHEKWCKKNPNNQHKCFAMCRHLERKTVVDHLYDEESADYHYEFTCLKLGQKMYSYYLEKRNLYAFKKLPEGVIRMPLVCDVFQEMTYDEQCKRFDL